LLLQAGQIPLPIKTLYIVRHAKSSWAAPGMDDLDRPLNERGLHDARMMAQRFDNRLEPVDLLMSSPAKRAITTANVFASVLGNAPVHEIDELYLAASRMLLSIIDRLPDGVRHAMLFGHNPGVSELVEELTGNGPGDLPTCAMVRIDFDGDSWQAVSAGTGTIKWWDWPKSA
jgi:phosphohistidine phosphatase